MAIESLSGWLLEVLARLSNKRDWSVECADRGRDGYVYYRESDGVIAFYWEFGGGDVVAIVSGGSEKVWKQEHPWAVARRSEILQRVANEVVRQKAPRCRADIDEQKGCIYLR